MVGQRGRVNMTALNPGNISFTTCEEESVDWRRVTLQSSRMLGGVRIDAVALTEDVAEQDIKTSVGGHNKEEVRRSCAFLASLCYNQVQVLQRRKRY